MATSVTPHSARSGNDSHARIQEYYGRVLEGSHSLKTSACCTPNSQPAWLKAILAQIEPEILERYYGCGSPLPPALEGCTVLDLGCGTGRDAYVCSRLAGAAGRVIGVDMTQEQLAIARSHQAAMAARFGYAQSNIAFHHGYMEELGALGIADGSVDVAISNCVLNLAPDKSKVFAEILRVLKPGGELFFADIFADRRLPPALAQDPVLLGECLGGAMYEQDFRRLLLSLGVPDYRVLTRRDVAIDDEEIARQLGGARFQSLTVRVFKLAGLEDRCEDYGQTARYRGTIPNHPTAFALDDHHRFETGRPMLVCSNTAAMLTATRLAPHFEVTGNRERHFGLFPCGPAEPAPATGGCCC